MCLLKYDLQAGKLPQAFVLSAPQKALVSTIQNGKKAISDANNGLKQPTDLSSLGGDHSSQRWMDSQKHSQKENVVSQVSAMNAATAQMVLKNLKGLVQNYMHPFIPI